VAISPCGPRAERVKHVGRAGELRLGLTSRLISAYAGLRALCQPSGEAPRTGTCVALFRQDRPQAGTTGHLRSALPHPLMGNCRDCRHAEAGEAGPPVLRQLEADDANGGRDTSDLQAHHRSRDPGAPFRRCGARWHSRSHRCRGTPRPVPGAMWLLRCCLANGTSPGPRARHDLSRRTVLGSDWWGDLGVVMQQIPPHHRRVARPRRKQDLVQVRYRQLAP
jgi:hypothetical protein